MSQINFKKTVSGELEPMIEKVTAMLKEEGFGILTRIDLHSKIKEKIGKDLRPAVILGACNPQLAFEAYTVNPDVASLLPCNAVIRDLGEGKLSIELAKPSTMMEMIGEQGLAQVAKAADERLSRALDRL